MEINELLENGSERFLPNLSLDHVIIGYQENMLKCLLLKMGKKWMLPGGYIRKEQSVEEAAFEILKERTGLTKPHLKFLSVFGSADRKFDNDFREFFKTTGLPWREDYFMHHRFVTLAYYSLVDIAKTHPVPGAFDEAIGWHNFDELPAMWLDHKTIALTARQRLKDDVRHELVTYNLLPNHFTMPELHLLHQTILAQKLDRSRFQKKMLASGLFERLPQLKNASPGRNPFQYRLVTKK
ncbi:MAG: NUDIX domain-containing protein [Bacteroidota bacterium]